MVNLFYDSYRILSKVYGEKAFIKQAINSEVIEPLNKNAVIKTCYGVIDNDIYLEYVISKFCQKRPKLPIRILLKIAIYSIKFLNKAPYAVTDSAVELCKKLGKGGMSGFLNAILRKFINNQNVELPKERVKMLSIKYSFPAFAVEQLISDYGEEVAEQIISHSEVNTFLRFSNCNGEDYLTSIGCSFQTTPFKNCFALKNFNREDGFFDGKYTFQSIGSVAICETIDKGEFLLDACAAPGGKSVALANKFQKVTSCEIHSHRAKLIEEYASRMKVSNIDIKVQDSTQFNEQFVEKFDTILCDVPCSGFGVTKENPDIKLNREYENLEQLNEIQLKILQTCSNYLKPGGSLYYSTCSIFKRENGDLIKRFLDSNSDFKLTIIDSPLNHLKDGIGLQFLPHISMGAGFYVCKMIKL